MKKKLTLLLLLITPFLAYSETVYVDALEYKTDPSTRTASITGSQPTTDKLIIPASITVDNVDYEVTSIGDEAFSYCYWLTGSVTIPNSITSIGERSFSQCRDLTGDLTIPNSVTSIGDEAFEGCYGLTGDLTIGNSVTSIGDSAFKGCNFSGTLTIPNSVTSIGGGAFGACGFIGGLNIGNSVTSIGDRAFAGCNFSGTLTIPNSVTFIGDYAFEGCDFTGDLTIPNSVTSIGYGAFEGCGFTGDLTIPNSVTSIGEIAFYENSITNIIVDTDNDYYSSVDGVLFNKNITEIICYPYGRNEIEHQYNIPNSVTSIGNYAFYECSGLIGNLTIPNSVTYIGDMAFLGCSGLTGNLIIPNSVTYIGERTFDNCIGLTGDLTIPNSVTYIGISAFGSCNIDKVIIENSTPCSIGEYPFPYNKFIYVPSGSLETYQADAAWSSNKYLIEADVELNITLSTPNALLAEVTKASSQPNKVNRLIISGELGDDDWSILKNDFTMLYYLDLSQTTNAAIPNEAFHSNSLLQTIILPNSATSIGEGAFAACYGLTGDLTIPNSVTSIGERAFQNCNFTGNLTIGNSVTSIGEGAFSRCWRFIGDLTIPNSVTYIGEGAFEECSFTGNLTISKSVTSIGKSIFEGCDFTGSLTIPNSVTSIGDRAFEGCSFTDGLTIPNSVTSIGERAFYESGITNIIVDTDNDYYSSVDGVLFNKDITEIICYPYGMNKTESKYNIPNSVTSIGSHAFASCYGLTGNLTIPNSVTSIGDYAFFKCTGLTGDLTIPNSVTSIGEHAFYDCTGFTGCLMIGGSVASIGEWAFASDFTEVKVNWDTPLDIHWVVFGTSFVFADATLLVPVGTLDTYKADEAWGMFGNIVEDSSLAVADNLADAAKVVAINGELMISGAEDGAAVKVYNLNGVTVANGVVTDGAAQIELPATKGIYIVIVGNQCYKVMR